ncbi:nudix hydrolase 13 [Pyrus ussuriensis x Pyrus communis]|uniref:Nudix hydrolase 13 n=1 Tax=Pyrus ussuriensis x Pyrus communis TaxID=2448454 RepID=A0A5N5G9E4_9ROSA|nr:nudix hydrolase 13 [Pyrus ussuriensis x Pyrus communis]
MEATTLPRQQRRDEKKKGDGGEMKEETPITVIKVVKCVKAFGENYEDDVESGDIENKIQVLMVSSPDRHGRVFPKGGWEDDETVLEAACREALEEAGVKGNLRETPLGVWEFRSKSREEMCNLSLEGGCRGYMFALEVTQELDTWPEHQNRDRKWLRIKEAFRVCRYEWTRKALEQFLRVMGGGLVLSVCDDNDNIDDEDGKVKVVEMMMGSEDEMKLGGELPPPDSTLQPPLSDVEHVMAECKIVSASASQLVISVDCHGTWLSRTRGGFPLMACRMHMTIDRTYMYIYMCARALPPIK